MQSGGLRIKGESAVVTSITICHTSFGGISGWSVVIKKDVTQVHQAGIFDIGFIFGVQDADPIKENSMEFNVISVAAVFASSILAAMGLGGGAVLLLYLTLMTDLSQPVSQATNLLLFIPAACMSLIIHRKNGLVNSKYLRSCLPWGIAGGIAGSLLGNNLSAGFLNKLFGIFLLFIGVREFYLAIRMILSEREDPTSAKNFRKGI